MSMTRGAAHLCVVTLLALPAWAAGPSTLEASPTGAQEVPTPGDSDGSGTVKLKLDPATEKVCVDIALKNIDPPVAAHIHAGAAGVAGPVVLGLPTPEGGVTSGCVTASKELIEKLLKAPGDYYFNVHTATYKSGALRGQLVASP
jgi:hypothetical protein